MKNWIKRYGILLGVFVLGVVVVVGLSIPIIRMYHSDPQSVNIFVALGTLLLAVATVALAFFTYYSVNNLHDKEKRDKKDRLLNDITEWAIEAAKSAISRQKTNENQLWTTKLQYKILVTKGTTYIKGISYTVFENLTDLVNDINEKLNKGIVELEKAIELRHKENTIPTTELLSTEGIKETERELKESVEVLLTKAAVINIKQAGFDVREEKQVVNKDNSKEPSLSEIKDLIKNTRVNPYAQGVFVAGIVQLGIYFTLILSTIFSLSNQEVYKEILTTTGNIYLVGGFFLTLGGWLWIKFGKR